MYVNTRRRQHTRVHARKETCGVCDLWCVGCVCGVIGVCLMFIVAGVVGVSPLPLIGRPQKLGLPMVVCVECLPADKPCDVKFATRRGSDVAPRACALVCARVLVPPNLYIHTRTYIAGVVGVSCIGLYKIFVCLFGDCALVNTILGMQHLLDCTIFPSFMLLSI